MTVDTSLLDPPQAAERLAGAIRRQVGATPHRGGVVTTMSGAVHGSACAALAQGAA